MLSEWSEVPDFAIRANYEDHEGFGDYRPWTLEERDIFSQEEVITREGVKKDLFAKTEESRAATIGTKSKPIVFVSPDGKEYLTDVPTRFAQAQGFEKESQRDRFKSLSQGREKAYLGWTSYSLESWADAPIDIERYVWGKHEGFK